MEAKQSTIIKLSLKIKLYFNWITSAIASFPRLKPTECGTPSANDDIILSLRANEMKRSNPK